MTRRSLGGEWVGQTVFYAQAAEATTAKPSRVGTGYVAAHRTYMFVARIPDHGEEVVASNDAIGATYR